MKHLSWALFYCLFLWHAPLLASKMLIPMDQSQSNHLKAYGIAFLSIASGQNVEWLLNYRGGSFLLEPSPVFQREASHRGVLFSVLSAGESILCLTQVSGPLLERPFYLPIWPRK